MRLLSTAIVVAAVIWLLAGCRDYEAEARINADAQRDVVRINADAGVTHTQISETAATGRNRAVVDVLPTGLLLIGIIGAAWPVLWHRGRVILHAIPGSPQHLIIRLTNRSDVMA